MPPFEMPDLPSQMATEWIKTAKPSFCSPELLKEYWQQFNTLHIPILNLELFFADAIAAAKCADTRRDLEKLLEEKCQMRLKESSNLITAIAFASIAPEGQLLSEPIRNAALRVGQTGSLDHFLQFVSGVVFGWGEDKEKGAQLDHSREIAGGIDVAAEIDTTESESTGSECEAQILPDAHFPQPNFPKDTGHHLDDDEWRFKEHPDSDEAPLKQSLPSPASRDVRSSLLQVEERKDGEKKENDAQDALTSTTTSNLPLESSPSSPLPRLDNVLDKQNSPSSPNEAPTNESPNHSHTTPPHTSHASSEFTGEESVDSSSQQNSPSASCPSEDRKRPRPDEDSDDDELDKDPCRPRKKRATYGDPGLQ